MSPKKKMWQISESNVENEKELVEKLGVSSQIAQILINRGITTVETAEEFLDPHIDKMHSPFLFEDMQKVVERIEHAIANEELILIYGDYDVDGITSVSLFLSYLRTIGGKVLYHIPKRLDEGYGMNVDAIEKASKHGVKLLITVDCGIGSIEEVKRAYALGMDVIVTDHHEPLDILPECIGIINPKVKGSQYPFKHLAGVGVAFKVCQALWERRGKPTGEEDIFKYIDIVALGTIADVVSLLGENRIIIKHGIDKINTNPCPGIKALIGLSSISGKQITSNGVSFVLAPKINACGRLGDPSIGVKLVLAKDIGVAEEIAKTLNDENIKRQQIEAEILEEATGQLSQIDQENVRAIVLASEDWHTGVIGIAASKIAEMTYRPTFLIAIDEDGVGKGSGRSIAEFDLHNALKECSDLLIKFGGHSQAAGMSIEKEKIPEFTKRFDEIAAKHLKDSKLKPILKVDCSLDNSNITLDFVKELKKLEPHGLANPIPVFASKGLSVVECRSVGNEGDHLKLKLGLGNSIFDAIGFRMGKKYGDYHDEVVNSGNVDVVYTLDINTWGRVMTPELIVKDIREYSEENQWR